MWFWTLSIESWAYQMGEWTHDEVTIVGLYMRDMLSELRRMNGVKACVQVVRVMKFLEVGHYRSKP